MSCTSILDQPPVFITGYPRSGTTFVARALREMGLPVTSEFHLGPPIRPILDQLEKLVTTLSGKKWRGISSPQERFAEALGAIMFAVSIPSIHCQGRTAQRLANKTPGLTEHIDYIERVFGPRTNYVYCLRHVLDVVRSVVNTDSGSVGEDAETPNRFCPREALPHIESWKKCVLGMEAFRASNPDRVFFFQVDRYTTRADRAAHLKAMSAAIHLEAPESTIDNIAHVWKKANDRPKLAYAELDNEIIATINGDVVIRDILDRHGYRSSES